MTFFEINPANKEIKIYIQLLKQFFSGTGDGVSDIVINFLFNEVIISLHDSATGSISLDQWNHLEDQINQLYLNSKVFSYSINTTKNSIELVFDAEVGMIGEY